MRWKLIICAASSPFICDGNTSFLVEVNEPEVPDRVRKLLLAVPQKCSVADLKELIRVTLRITSCEQLQNPTLYFEGEQQLSDATTLVDVPNLRDGSSLLLSYFSSYGMRQLNIEDVARHTMTSVTIKVGPDSTFTTRLAKMIEVSTGVSACQQKLFHNGKLLTGAPPHGSTVTLFRCTTWNLRVSLSGCYTEPSSFSIAIPNPQKVSIAFLKNFIEKKTRLLPRKQVLYSRTCHLCMGPYDHDRTKVRITQPDHYPLCESPLRDGAVVLVERFTGWHLHIKMMDGSTTMITVDNPRTVTIMELKQMCSSTGVPPPEQRLVTSDHEILEDIWIDEDNKAHQKRLKLYPQVGDESVIHLVRLTERRVKIGYDEVEFYFSVPEEVQYVADLKKPVGQMLKIGIGRMYGTCCGAGKFDKVNPHYEYHIASVMP